MWGPSLGTWPWLIQCSDKCHHHRCTSEWLWPLIYKTGLAERHVDTLLLVSAQDLSWTRHVLPWLKFPRQGLIPDTFFLRSSHSFFGPEVSEVQCRSLVEVWETNQKINKASRRICLQCCLVWLQRWKEFNFSLTFTGHHPPPHWTSVHHLW